MKCDRCPADAMVRAVHRGTSQAIYLCGHCTREAFRDENDAHTRGIRITYIRQGFWWKKHQP